MTYAQLGERLDRQYTRRRIAAYLQDSRAYIAIGRSSNSAGFSANTPIVRVPGGCAPRLEGKPYLKTIYRRGNFSRTLYTHSTLHVVVGENW